MNKGGQFQFLYLGFSSCCSFLGYHTFFHRPFCYQKWFFYFTHTLTLTALLQHNFQEPQNGNSYWQKEEHLKRCSLLREKQSFNQQLLSVFDHFWENHIAGPLESCSLPSGCSHSVHGQTSRHHTYSSLRELVNKLCPVLWTSYLNKANHA